MYRKVKFFEPYPFQEMDEHDDDFSIDHGVIHSKDFCIDLIKLPIATLLWPFIPEHWANAVELRYRIKGGKLMLKIGTSHGGGGFRTKGQRVSTSVCEGIHLLFDNVSSFADPPGKKFCPLENGNADLREAKFFKNLPGSFLNKLPLPNLVRKDVIETTNGFYFHP